MMLISEKIFKLISEQGMTQKTFASRTGIPQSTISDWKSKKLNPSSDKILIICDVLGVTPYELLSGTESGKYELPERLVVEKGTDEYEIVQEFRQLKPAQKNRLLGYIEALSIQ